MLVYEHDCIVQRFQFRDMIAVGVLAVHPAQIVQLGQQAFAQVARAYPDRVHLLHYIDGFAEGVSAEWDAGGRGARRNQRRTPELRLGVGGYHLRYGNLLHFRLFLQHFFRYRNAIAFIQRFQTVRCRRRRCCNCGLNAFRILRRRHLADGQSGFMRLFLCQAKQFIVRRRQVAFFVQIADHQLGSAIHILIDVQ